MDSLSKYSLCRWIFSPLNSSTIITGISPKSSAIGCRALKDKLREHQRILSIQLRIQQTQAHSLEGLAPDDHAAEPAAPAGQQVLADIDRQFQDLAAESDSPAEYLRQLTAVLNAPQEVLSVAPIVLRLNWMGVRQDDASAACRPGIHLAEVKLHNRLKRVAVLVLIAREDCLGR